MTPAPEAAPQPETSNDESVHGLWILGSLLSFIPMCGALIGAVCLLYGLLNPKRYAKLVAAFGFLGICSSVVIYGTLFYKMADPSSEFGAMRRTMLSTQTLPQVVKSIEYYRIQHGKYPASLDELPGNEIALARVQHPGVGSQGDLYYVLDAESGKYLLGTEGLDHIRFTADDVLPLIPPEEAAKIGYTTKADLRDK